MDGKGLPGLICSGASGTPVELFIHSIATLSRFEVHLLTRSTSDLPKLTPALKDELEPTLLKPTGVFAEYRKSLHKTAAR